MSGVDLEELRNRLHLSVSALDNWYFDDDLCQRTLKDHFHVGTLEGLGLKDYDLRYHSRRGPSYLSPGDPEKFSGPYEEDHSLCDR